jgi:hypothetical protein
MRVLAQEKIEGLIDGRFHMFAGLAWDGHIGGASSGEYFVSELRTLMDAVRGHLPRKSPTKILSFDTANSGSGANGLLGRLDEAVTGEHGQVESKVAVIVNHAEALEQEADSTKLELDSSLDPVWLQKPSAYVGPEVVAAFDWIDLPMSSVGHRLRLSYWPYSCVPTEDNAEFMGVRSSHKDLGVETTGQLGAIILTRDDGMDSYLGGPRSATA